MRCPRGISTLVGQMALFLFSINTVVTIVAAAIRRPNMGKTATAVSVETDVLSASIETRAQNPNPKIEYAAVDFSDGVFTILDDLKMIGVINQLVF